MNDFTYQETLELAAQIEEENPKALIVPHKLSNPEPLVTQAKRHFEMETNERDYTRYLWSREGILGIYVTKQTRGRALRFFNSFIKLAKIRGHNINVEGNETKVIIRDIPLKIRLREPQKVIDVPKKYTWESRTLKPTGTLCFSYDMWGRSTGKEWYDSNSTKLEDKLAVIMAFLELKAGEEIRIKEKAELNRLIWERKEELRKQKEELINNERIAYNTLMIEADRWSKFEKLSNYIHELEKENSKPKEWIEWAKQKAKWLDPRNDVEDEILGKYR